MPKLPRVTAREAIRALERLRFSQTRQKGSHVVMKKRVRLNLETEDGIAYELESAGIPKEHIVLAFKSMERRRLTEYAVS